MRALHGSTVKSLAGSRWASTVKDNGGRVASECFRPGGKARSSSAPLQGLADLLWSRQAAKQTSHHDRGRRPPLRQWGHARSHIAQEQPSVAPKEEPRIGPYTSSEIVSLFKRHHFTLPPEAIAELRARTGMTAEALFEALVQPARALARPPISRFHVAALGLGASGRAYLGVNLEFPGLPLSHSVHAEQFMVANAMRHGERRLLSLVVSHAPCGHCRQFLQELRGAQGLRVVIAEGGSGGEGGGGGGGGGHGTTADARQLLDFLPHHFGPRDLLHESFPLLLEVRHNGLRVDLAELQDLSGGLRPSANAAGPHLAASASSRSPLGVNGSAGSASRADGVSPGPGTLGSLLASGSAPGEPSGGRRPLRGGGQASGVEGPARREEGAMLSAALEAANASYAPYTHSPSGVSVRTASGRIYAGSYLESAAYNPSLPSLQGALIGYVSQEQGDYSDIVDAVLVERDGAPVLFGSTARIAFSQIAPAAAFRAVLARP